MKDHEIPLIIKTAQSIIYTACHLSGDQNNKGGCLCVSTNVHVTPLVVTLVGEVPDIQKQKDCWNRCQNESVRLARHSTHVSSWQTRDEIAFQYGGAIRACGYIFSFSGLTEHWNEACMVVLATQLKTRLLFELIPKAFIEIVSGISNNPFTQKLYNVTIPEEEKMRM